MTPVKEPPTLSVSGVTVVYSRWGVEVTALDHVGFEADAGEWLALLGPNGAGKSTLLRALMTLVPLAEGMVALHGRSLPHQPSSRRSSAMFLVHQSPLFGTAPLLTPTENLVVAGSISRKEARALLDEHGLGARAEQPTGTLSGGERQYLAILIATLRRPAVLLLDEPFSALDVDREARCLAELRSFRDAGGTLLHVTHQPAALIGSATRRIVLEDGRIVSDEMFDRAETAP